MLLLKTVKKYLETIEVTSQVKSNFSSIESLFNTTKFEPERSETHKSKSIKDNTSFFGFEKPKKQRSSEMVFFFIINRKFKNSLRMHML